jgi:multimeric flavodoxin WrbA
MKILGISGSPRSEECSGVRTLVEAVLDATGLDYDLFSLRGKKITGCTACLGCVKDNVCKVVDDMTPLREKIVAADAYVIGAPNYYTTINGLTHAVLERFYQFRHQEGDLLWGKLAVAVGVGGSTGKPCCDEIEKFMAYNFIETIAKIHAQGAASCFTCGYGESCAVGAVRMLYGPDVKITEDMIPNVEKQPEVLAAAKEAGIALADRLKNHDRKKTTARMQQLMTEKFKQTT